jgi:ElaB/YqjD/DUF883 family membrane-anchored ribosome-binding protein
VRQVLPTRFVIRNRRESRASTDGADLNAARYWPWFFQLETTMENSTETAGSTANGNGTQFKELFDGVDDLIQRIADVQSPEIQKIRAKARVALGAARSAVKDSAAHMQRQARQLAQTTDGYVHESPWQVIAAATAIGFLAGLALGRRGSAD